MIYTSKNREWDLTGIQRKTAQYLALGDPETAEYYPIVKLCEILDVPRSTFYTWKQNPEFVEYVNYLADMAQASDIVKYYRVLDNIIVNGENEHAKLKGIELVLKRAGKLRDVGKLEVDIGNKDVADKSTDEILSEIERLRKEVHGDESDDT